MHKTFSIEKLKSKIGRRFSEPSVFDLSATLPGERRNSTSNPVIIVSEEQGLVALRMRASSLSHGAPPQNRSRLHSVTRKQAKELIRQETLQVILKKLNHILADLGLQLPIAIRTCTAGLGGLPAKLVRVYVANSNDCVYLAPALSASFTYEDVENGGTGIETDALDHALPLLESALGDPPPAPPAASALDELAAKMRTVLLPNYLCTQIDSDTLIPHVFAVIVELKKDAVIKNVKADFSSTTQTLWPTGDSHGRHHQKEKFNIGAMDWTLAMLDADYYISTTNSNDTKYRDISPATLAQRTRVYNMAKMKKPDDFRRARTPSDVGPDADASPGRSRSGSHSSPQPELCKAGLYVFLLPVLFPPHIPATITSVNGSLVHRLAVNVRGVNEKMSRKALTCASYSLPMVRTPPSLANSIADKPIYVNRVWNDAIHYLITFPKKYLSLGSEHTINVKLVPLVKDVIVKRIKFNVLERLTYVSEDLTKEYEYDGDDPSMTKGYRSSRSRERVVPICELTTKNKNSFNGQPEPYKEEVISCPDNNLLFSCYEGSMAGNMDPLARAKDDNFVMIASPLDISIALPFLTSRSDKEMMTSSLDDAVEPPVRSNPTSRKASLANFDSVQGVCPSSPVIGSLETHISHMAGEQYSNDQTEDVLKLESSSLMLDVNSSKRDSIAQGYTSTQKALSPDSNFRHIQISHRLQVCFRISKPDAADNNRMHHYEVVVDTPLILLSAKCNEDSIQLPKYDEIQGVALPDPPFLSTRGITFRTPSYCKNGVTIKPYDPEGVEQLPSFEEATSTANSPIMRSLSLGDNEISRMNSLTPSDPAPAYDTAGNVNQENLVSPFSIDDLVVDPPLAVSRRRESSVRASLANSFAAHTLSPTNKLDKSSRDNLFKTEATLEGRMSELTDSSSMIQLSLETMDSRASSSRHTVSTENLSMSNELMHDHHCRDSSVTPEAGNDSEGALLLSSGLSDIDPTMTADGAESILTQETQFEQKLPLLQNGSVNDVGRVLSYAGRTREDLSKMLTDTLNQEPQVPGLFHAY